MPEEEAAAQPEAPKQQVPLFGGMKGWIVIIAVVVLEAVFFLIVLSLQSGKGVPEAEGDQIPSMTAKEFNQHMITLEGLNYSIKTAGGTSATLSMDIDIFLGYKEKELQQTDFTLTQPQWEQFKGAVTAMTPDIKSELVRHIHQQTYNQLASATGKEKIEELVKQYVNTQLKRLRFEGMEKIDKDRVIKVLITRFYLQ